MPASAAPCFAARSGDCASNPAAASRCWCRDGSRIYEANGRYQIVVEHMEEAGEGLLRRQFEELKARLQRGRPVRRGAQATTSRLPLRIGVVTSPTGAAMRDILHILKRRMPLAEVVLYPTRVQGEGAREEIVRAIETANARAETMH